jgi:hypothetical protein
LGAIALSTLDASAQPTVEIRAVKINGQPIEPTNHLEVNGGEIVEAEFWLRDWSPNGERLVAYDIVIDSRGLSNGNGACSLVLEHPPGPRFDCPCETDEDCETCDEATLCDLRWFACSLGPTHAPEEGSDINLHHCELIDGVLVNTYVFASPGPCATPPMSIAGIDFSSPDVRFTAALADPFFAQAFTTEKYAATLILEVPDMGSFIVTPLREQFLGGPLLTHLYDENGNDIEPYNLIPLTIDTGFLCESFPCPIGPTLPNNCAIDARQPSNPDGTNPAGWNFVDLAFDGDPSLLTPEDFAVREVPDATPPDITSISVREGNTLRLHFNRRITLRSWTCVTAVVAGCSGGTDEVCFAHNPADVNNDGVATPSDILHLIDCLNGVRTCQTHQCDVDRSNVCGPPDILRVIDILNPPWTDFLPPRRLSECPSGP